MDPEICFSQIHHISFKQQRSMELMIDKKYFSDKQQNADFIRCSNFIAEMIQKYGPLIKAEKAEKEKAV